MKLQIHKTSQNQQKYLLKSPIANLQICIESTHRDATSHIWPFSLDVKLGKVWILEG